MSNPSFRTRLKQALFWGVISAAFIGPGTVTTAAKAGAGFGTQLLWALSFSTLATLVLQEAAARIPMVSGLNLGEAIAQRFGQQGKKRVGWGLMLVVGFGCAAYQAGNLLGAASGLQILLPIEARWLVLLMGLLAALMLWQGGIQRTARLLGWIVAAMGILFLVVAFQTPIQVAEVTMGALVPSIPEGGELLVIGLIGTTIVPYNLFLGSGISQGKDLGTMRWGLGLAVVLGGIISMLILLVGTQVLGEFSFEALATALSEKTGTYGKALFGLGLFAAGFTSSVTAPLAAAVAGQGLLGKENPHWKPEGKAFRSTWAIVLLIGVVFGSLGIPPVPAIIMAQALNGLLLPFVVVFLYLIVNDARVTPTAHRNPVWLNGLTLLILGIAIFLGGLNLWRAIIRAGGEAMANQTPHLGVLGIVALILTVGVGVWANQQNRLS